MNAGAVVLCRDALSGIFALCALATAGGAQQAAHASPPAALVFDGVTVVDVEQGKLLAGQRVVVVGNRIRAVGSAKTVPLPQGAQVVDGQGKYLIPGLWDMHTHPDRQTEVYYPLFLANGVTGIREAGYTSPELGSVVPFDTLIHWRREIVAGARIGPPRQILSGVQICGSTPLICPPDSAEARRLVDSLAAAGADMLKMYSLSPEMYFAVAREARHLGLPFGGHADGPSVDRLIFPGDASDSGARIIDHLSALLINPNDLIGAGLLCLPPNGLAACRPLAERLRRNQTWLVLTAVVQYSLLARFEREGQGHVAVEMLGPEFWVDSLSNPYTPSALAAITADSTVYGQFLRRAHAAGMEFLAGTDAGVLEDSRPPGFSLHAELATLVAWGLTPLEALQTATLNPAKMWHATDSLGTVTAGKLADLVLLDANPLADITNTVAVRAVVANGRYFDRATLDRLIVDAKVRHREWSQKQARGVP